MVVLVPVNCFPALFAPASLKRDNAAGRGMLASGFPALFAPASLKHLAAREGRAETIAVFRRFLRRPH